jgi:uridine kinase
VTVESFQALATRLLGEPARVGGTRLVAVDGPSGAGKTVFAERLAGAIRGEGVDVPVVHTDDLLDGWSDQVSFWPRLEEWVLAPLRRGQGGSYRRYDWYAGRFGQEWTPVPPAPVVLVEGVTAARAAIRPELTLSVFLTAPTGLCLQRAVARDGEAMRAYLEEWQRGEQRHFAGDATAEHADLVVDAASSVPHDPARQFIRVCGRSGPGVDVLSRVRHDQVHGASPGGGCWP